MLKEGVSWEESLKANCIEVDRCISFWLAAFFGLSSVCGL